MSTITSTTFKLPGYVVSNGDTTGNPWLNPNYLLFVDDNLSESDANAGSASDVMIGGFNSNLPQNAVITGIELKLIAKRGALAVPAQDLTLYAVDNTSGADVLYPYIAPVSLSASLATYILGTPNYQFSTSFTPDQINNLKFLLEANGDIYVDSLLLKVYYYIPDAVPEPDPTDPGCPTCNSPIQVQAMSLAQPFLVGDTIFYLKKGCWAYPDGTPIQVEDLGACGGEIPLVFDQGVPKGSTGNNQFEECALFKTSEGTFEILPSGIVKVDLGSINNRGLQFHTPYGHVSDLMSDHPANSEVIISNSAIFESKHIRECQIGSVVSAPIEVKEEGVQVLKPVSKFNFTGGGQNVTADGTDDEQVNINIPGFTTPPPNVVSVTSYTSLGVQVLSGSADLDVSGLNRGAVVQICTEQARTIVSVTVGGVACTREAFVIDVAHNLRQESWVCINPPLGTQAVVVTLSGVGYLTFGAEALAQIDTSDMVGNTQTASGNNNAPTLTFNTANDNSIVIDGLVTAQTPILYTPGAGQSANWNRTTNASTRQGGSSVENAGIAPDSITMSYALTQSTPWALTALEINGIPASTPVVSPLTVQDESGGVSVPNVVKIVVPDTHLNSPVATEADITFQRVDQQVTQTAHGFSTDDILKSSGTDGEYDLAQANVIANAAVAGIVAGVIDANNFVIVTEGFIELGALPGGAVAGDLLYLDDATPGAFTLTAPSAGGTIVKQLGQVIDASSGLIYFHNFIGLTQAQNNPSGGGGTDVQVFVANGTWTKPAGAKAVQVICVGGGGGGGGGRSFYGSGSAGVGGCGGGGGAVTKEIFDASLLGATEAVVSGAGGAGGSGVGGTGGNGAPGSDGALTKFGDWTQAGGGGGGAGGQAGGGNVPGAGGGGFSSANLSTGGLPLGAAGVNAFANQGARIDGLSSEYGGASGSAGSNGGSSIYAGGGGGAGAANGGGGGGNGGTVGAYTASGGGAPGTSGAVPTAGGAGKANSVLKKGYGGEGGGGGGGTSTNGVSAGNGGVGGLPGGGGGGGGGFSNNVAVSGGSGNGGAGGHGKCIVITYL